jgi:hypothetical protein
MIKYITLSLIIASIIITVPQPSISQDGPTSSIGLMGSANIPQGDFADWDQYSTSMGFMAFMNYAIAANIMLNAYIGYINWSLKNELPSGYESTFAFLPIMLAASYYFMIPFTNLYLYAGLGLGPFMKFDRYKSPFGENTDNKAYFGVSPMIGLYYQLGAMFYITLQGSFPVVFADPKNFTYLSIALGVAISLNLFSE